jgi:ADP-heptose:LPS heptosyltransferase
MSDPSDFYAQSREAKKILAIEDPALGDSIHLLPALKLLREAYPRAELHVMAGPPSFFRSVAPWIDRVWPEMPRPTLANVPVARALRRERIEAVFCFSSHNRANLLANLIGARWRAGRHSDHNKPWWWQPLLYTRTVDYPWHLEPMFLQHWHTAKGFGVPGDTVAFGAQIKPEWFVEAGMSADERKTYVHVSPFYVFPGKELPMAQYVDLLTRLQQR